MPWMRDVLSSLLDWYLGALDQGGYGLAWVGVTAGQDPQVLSGSVHRISLWVGGLMLFIGTLYYLFVHRQMRR